MKKTLFQKIHWQFIVFLARRLPPCKAMVETISEERERTLTLREKITLKLHLFTCEACRRYVAQVEQMSKMIKPKPEEGEPTERLSPAVRDRIKAALEAARREK